MSSALPNVRRQHYVWRAYLERWAVNGNVHCLRAGRIFCTDPVNLAVERDFHRLEHLTPADISYLERLVISQSPPHAQRIHRQLMDFFQFPFAVLQALDKSSPSAPADIAELNVIINTMEETLHSGIESNAVQYLDEMLTGKGSVAFFEDERHAVLFCQFIAVQNFRTKKMQDRTVAALEASFAGHAAEFSTRRTWNLARHFFATNIGCSLYLERRDYRLVLLENGTLTPFITTDHPVINVCDHYDQNGQVVDLYYYYPLAPHRALLMTKLHHQYQNCRAELTAEEVNSYNKKLFEDSHQQVYSSSMESLIALQSVASN